MEICYIEAGVLERMLARAENLDVYKRQVVDPDLLRLSFSFPYDKNRLSMTIPVSYTHRDVAAPEAKRISAIRNVRN